VSRRAEWLRVLENAGGFSADDDLPSGSWPFRWLMLLLDGCEATTDANNGAEPPSITAVAQLLEVAYHRGGSDTLAGMLDLPKLGERIASIASEIDANFFALREAAVKVSATVPLSTDDLRSTEWSAWVAFADALESLRRVLYGRVPT
jgi:hypothetical protein